MRVLTAWFARISAFTAIVVATALLPAATAQAIPDTTQLVQTCTFKLCNKGSGYSTYAVFPDRGGWATTFVAPGQPRSTVRILITGVGWVPGVPSGCGQR